MTRIPWTVRAALLLGVLLVAGAAARIDPDFDVTFGVEAWRAAGPGAAAASAAILVALVVFPRAAQFVGDAVAAVVGRVPPGARVPLLLAAALALFVVLADVSLSGDAMDAVRRTAAREVQPSNAVASWLHFASAALPGVDAVDAVRAVSWASGVAGVAAAVALARELFGDGPRRVAAAFLLLTTGNAALFFGSVEVYAPLGAAVLVYLLVAVRSMTARGRWSAALPPLVLGAAFGVHGAAGLLLPSLALLAWGGGGRGAVLRVVRALALFAVPVVAVFAGLVLWNWRGALPAAGPALWGNFLGAGGDGPLPPLRLDPADPLPRYALLDLEHVLAALSALFLAAPAAWAVLASVLPAPRGPAPPARLVRFAAAALVPLALLPFLWNVTYGLRRDWDLMSVSAAPAALLAALLALREPGNVARAVQAAALGLFAFAPFVAANAGTVPERRLFAQAAAYTLRSSPGVGDPVRRAAAIRRWDAAAAGLDPAGASARIDEGEALVREARPEDALARFDAALAAEPDDAFALRGRGLALLALGRRDEARASLLASLRTPRENLRVPARRGLARIASGGGDAAEAARQLGRALREDSECAEAPAVAREAAAAWRTLGRDDVAAALERFAARRTRY